MQVGEFESDAGGGHLGGEVAVEVGDVARPGVVAAGGPSRVVAGVAVMVGVCDAALGVGGVAAEGGVEGPGHAGAALRLAGEHVVGVVGGAEVSAAACVGGGGGGDVALGVVGVASVGVAVGAVVGGGFGGPGGVLAGAVAVRGVGGEAGAVRVGVVGVGAGGALAVFGVLDAGDAVVVVVVVVLGAGQRGAGAAVPAMVWLIQSPSALGMTVSVSGAVQSVSS